LLMQTKNPTPSKGTNAFGYSPLGMTLTKSILIVLRILLMFSLFQAYKVLINAIKKMTI
jgi:hypothetical protein